MKKLLKAYGFNSDMQYFERIVHLYLDGDLAASTVMFKDMPVKERKQFCASALWEWSSGLTTQQIIRFLKMI